MSSTRIYYEVLGLRIAVTARDPSDAARLAHAYGHWHNRTCVGRSDVELVCETATPYGLVDLQRQIDEVVLSHLRDVAVAHAGVAEIGGRLLVFPGLSRTGKSSLVTHLVERGARYYSDEYAIIDPDGRVHAYPRPIVLRDADGRDYVDTSRPVPVLALAPRRPDAVLFLTHVPGQPGAALRRIDSASATMGLLKNTPQVLADRPGLMRFFAAATESARAYEGLRGDAAPAWRAIERILQDDERDHRVDLGTYCGQESQVFRGTATEELLPRN